MAERAGGVLGYRRCEKGKEEQSKIIFVEGLEPWPYSHMVSQDAYQQLLVAVSADTLFATSHICLGGPIVGDGERGNTGVDKEQQWLCRVLGSGDSGQTFASHVRLVSMKWYALCAVCSERWYRPGPGGA